jgi:hypothetical protein
MTLNPRRWHSSKTVHVLNSHILFLFSATLNLFPHIFLMIMQRQAAAENTELCERSEKNL